MDKAAGLQTWKSVNVTLVHMTGDVDLQWGGGGGGGDSERSDKCPDFRWR